MVDSISSPIAYDPLAQLNKIKGITPPAAPKPAATTATNSGNPLPSNNPVGVTSDVLSVLQGTGPGSLNGQLLGNLLGGTGTNNPLAGLFSAALSGNSTLAPLQNALASLKQQKAQLGTQTDFVGKAIADQHKATNAYNKTLITNAQNAIKDSFKV
jgi:hypothetical protein